MAQYITKKDSYDLTRSAALQLLHTLLQRLAFGLELEVLRLDLDVLLHGAHPLGFHGRELGRGRLLLVGDGLARGINLLDERGVDAGAGFDLVYVDGDHSRAGALFDIVPLFGGSDDVRELRVMRVMRVLRLIKLAAPDYWVLKLASVVGLIFMQTW